MSTLSLPDRFRRWSYLQDLELWLDPMPGRRRREVLRDLRATLADAAADVGMTQAIEDLGKPRDLARELVKAEPRRRPSWSFGVLGATGVLLVAVLTGLAYMFGLSDALIDGGGGTAEGRFLGLNVTATASEDSWAWTWSGISWPVVIAMLLAFLLASSAWRLLRR